MKTIYQTVIKKYQLLLLGVIMITLSSCSSFKNSSYDDYDGIYSSSTSETTRDENQTYNQVNSNNLYVDKFKDMQEEFGGAEYFTDVDSYSSNQVDTVYVVERSYAGWGNNSNEVNINYYNNGWNNWGWGFNSWYGPGWNNGFYYGNTWGLGFNYGWNNWYNPYYGYGFGWNNWYNPYFGGYYIGHYNNHVSYNSGIRGRNGIYSGRSSGRTATVIGRKSQIGNSSARSTTRTRSNSTTRSTSTRSNNSTVSPRSTTTNPRSTSTRTTTTPRSSNSSGTYGGSRSSGSSSRGTSGGGRSSGGGGRGGRG